MLKVHQLAKQVILSSGEKSMSTSPLGSTRRVFPVINDRNFVNGCKDWILDRLLSDASTGIEELTIFITNITVKFFVQLCMLGQFRLKLFFASLVKYDQVLLYHSQQFNIVQTSSCNNVKPLFMTHFQARHRSLSQHMRGVCPQVKQQGRVNEHHSYRVPHDAFFNSRFLSKNVTSKSNRLGIKLPTTDIRASDHMDYTLKNQNL